LKGGHANVFTRNKVSSEMIRQFYRDSFTGTLQLDGYRIKRG
jgi:hypothetical protein